MPQLTAAPASPPKMSVLILDISCLREMQKDARAHVFLHHPFAAARHRDSQHMAVVLRSWQRRQSLLPTATLGLRPNTTIFSRKGTDRHQSLIKSFVVGFFLNEVFSFPFVKSRQGQSAARGTNASHGDF